MGFCGVSILFFWFLLLPILLVFSSRRFFHAIRPPQQLALDLQVLLILKEGYVWKYLHFE